MNKKNYKQNLKKSFILCGIMLGIILLIFVFATMVNSKVADNMTGSMLYISRANSTDAGMAYICDFDNKNNIELKEINRLAKEASGTVSALRFINRDTVAAVLTGENGMEIYSCGTDGKAVKRLYINEDLNRLISFEPDREGNRALVCASGGGQSAVIFTLEISTGTTTMCYGYDDGTGTAGMITGTCYSADYSEIYFSTISSGIYSVKTDGSAKKMLCSTGGENMAVTTVNSGNLIIQRNDSKQFFSVLYPEREKESRLKFCESDYNWYGLCPVSENMYIVGSDKRGKGDIYVCNGSNTDPVEAVNDDMINIPQDYINSEQK